MPEIENQKLFYKNVQPVLHCQHKILYNLFPVRGQKISKDKQKKYVIISLIVKIFWMDSQVSL